MEYVLVANVLGLLLVLCCSLARLNQLPVLLRGACLLSLAKTHDQGFFDLVRVVDEVGSSTGLRCRLREVLLS